MRKWMVVVSVAFVFLLLCVGCDQNVKSVSSMPGVDTLSLNQGEGVVRLLTRSTMPSMCTGIKEGCYELTLIPETTACNIKYIDYATQMRVYLCNRPDCKHSDDSCTAWIGGDLLPAYLVASSNGEKLFCLSFLEGSSGAQDLLVMDKNGANRRQLCRLPANEVFTDAIAGDDKYLYIAVQVTATAEEEPRKELRRIDMETGEMSVLLTTGHNSWLAGAFEDKLVIHQYISANGDAIGKGVVGEERYLLYSLSSGQETEVHRYAVDDTGDSEVGSIAEPDGTGLYIISPDGDLKGNITRLDMVSGEEKTVYEGMPLYKLSTTHFVSFYDGNMVVNVTDNLSGSDHVKRYRYVFMPETGELVENTLRANISGMEDFVNIYASTDDYYLVAHNTVNYPLTLVDNAGVPYTVEASENQYALIAKADYWNSVPNYIPIVDE